MDCKGGAVLAGAVLAGAALVAGCRHLGPHWPWQHRPAAASAPVHALDISGPGADALAQSWKRNTLLIDLSAASGSGSITLRPLPDSGWPMRLAFKVTPGAIGVLEARAAQRVSLPISSTGGKPVDLELPPGVYSLRSPEMTVSWGQAGLTGAQ
ncbi:MAG: hypothetical protein JOZ89_00015 [Gammaproteobacteria bacterium]|nr:hypothetical protein [Gammaproteobacteria bacterium]